MARYVTLEPGDPAPWFRQRSLTNPSYAFDTAAGRCMVLCFFGSVREEHSVAALRAVLERRDLFDDTRASFFGLTSDPRDAAPGVLRDTYPGYRFLLDLDGAAGQLYGAVRLGPLTAGEAVEIRRLWVVLDPAMRVRGVIPFAPDGSDIPRAIALAEASAAASAAALPAPVLMLPDVFEPELRRTLIARYDTLGGVESGFMRQIDGKTHMIHDHAHKRRRDHLIEDMDLIRLTQARFNRRVVPQIERAYQFKATRMERYIVACYAAEDQAHFKPHRDNTTSGTAHRRFAVSINLNDEFEGGEVYFPEYGMRTYKPAPGAALVFSCSLLHAVTPMRRGKRYAFLPFLYDEAAALVREANNAHLGPGVDAYRAGVVESARLTPERASD